MRLFLATLLALLASTSIATTKQTTGEACYSDKNVRFTVITDGVIRMEYNEEGKFCNNPSFIAVNRSYPSVTYDINVNSKKVTIKTERMVLTYKKGTGAFNANNLTITSTPKTGCNFVWHPGMKQKQNLGGTYRTLDGYDGDRYWAWGRSADGAPMQLEDGILARDGWTLIDDSKGLLFDGDVTDTSGADLPWVEERKSDTAQDLYFMAYGHDYKRALTDYVTFAGRIPLPPRFTFGYWWSRYWSYSDAEMREVVNLFDRYRLPLDVLVVDMDWHWTEEGKGGWTGYTWNTRLFPNPEKFLKYLKSKNLQITVNLHPADGVPAYEDKYPALAEYLGLNPESKQTIPYKGSNHRFMRGWLDKMVQPLTDQGVDFMWLDWQQGLQDDSIPALSNTWWINYCTFDNQLRNGSHSRPMLYHRWGGMGNHRYQIGFSGDTYSTWASLDYQPYFNSVASNVGYGYWSHDLGGHMFVNDSDSLDTELYSRWMQLGIYLPIMRSHSSKNARMLKEPWSLGATYQPIVSDAILERYRLAPYIYTAAREAFETGVSLCRPLYYDYPEDEQSYATEYRNEYMFGPDLLIAPITAPMTGGVSAQKIWLPKGWWFEKCTGTLLEGGREYERAFMAEDYPVYVKAGAIIPNYTAAQNLARNDEAVTLLVYPSATAANVKTAQMYEDAGNDQNYASQYAVTDYDCHWTEGKQVITIHPRRGEYANMPATRQYEIELVGVHNPARVTIDGKDVAVNYSTTKLSATIQLGALDLAQSHTVEVFYAGNDVNLNDGLAGKMQRLRKTLTAMKYRDAGIVLIEGLGEMGSLAEALEYYPERTAQLVNEFNNSYNNLPTLLEKQHLSDTDRQWFIHSVGFNYTK